jgi:GDPmannose 4,6-dehydratase
MYLAQLCTTNESIYRPIHYVTRKISSGAAAIAHGKAFKLSIGNLHAERDWGYAADYMQAAYLMLRQYRPSNYVVASGHVHSVPELLSIAFMEVGLCGRERDFLEIDKSLIRPREILRLIGDPSRARGVIGWEPTKTFIDVFREMVHYVLWLLTQ